MKLLRESVGQKGENRIFMRKEEEEELLAGGLRALGCQWSRTDISIGEASWNAFIAREKARVFKILDCTLKQRDSTARSSIN